MKNKFKSILLLLLALVIINLIGQQFFHRFDFTKDKRFTLHPLTINELGALKEPIHITIFLDGDLPATFKKLKNSVQDLLLDYKAYAHGALSIQFVNLLDEAPQPDSLAKLVSTLGIEATNLSIKTESGFQQKLIFPEAIISYQNRETRVKLLQNFSGNYEANINNSIENLEFTFTSAIKKIIENKHPRIAFTEGHGELNDLQIQDAMNSLAVNYEVGRVKLKEIKQEGLDKIKLLIIAKPQTAFTEAEKYKIDYLVQKGTPIIWSIDQVSADLDSLQGSGNQLAFNNQLNIDDMLFEYGVRINYNVIADMNCSQIPLKVGDVAGQAQLQMVPWLYYPILIPDSTHIFVRDLDGIRSEFPSSLDEIKAKGIQHQVLLSSSPYRKLFPTPKMFNLQMVEEEPNPKEFYGKPLPVAMLLKGKFYPIFNHRPIPAGAEVLPFGPTKENKMVVIADGDLFKNQISKTDGAPFPLGFDRFTQQNYGNKNFLLNLSDGLMDASGLLGLRSKQFKIRLLDKVKVKEDKFKWQLTCTLLPLLLLIIFGFFQHYFRKRTFAK